MSEVDHPPHYRHLGVECIDVAEHFNYCMGNALKYIWRADYKGNPVQDLQKSVWYLNREIERRQKSFANSEKIESDNPFYYSPEFVVARDDIMEDSLDVLNKNRGWIKSRKPPRGVILSGLMGGRFGCAVIPKER